MTILTEEKNMIKMAILVYYIHENKQTNKRHDKYHKESHKNDKQQKV